MKLEVIKEAANESLCFCLSLSHARNPIEISILGHILRFSPYNRVLHSHCLSSLSSIKNHSSANTFLSNLNKFITMENDSRGHLGRCAAFHIRVFCHSKGIGLFQGLFRIIVWLQRLRCFYVILSEMTAVFIIDSDSDLDNKLTILNVQYWLSP